MILSLFSFLSDRVKEDGREAEFRMVDSKRFRIRHESNKIRLVRKVSTRRKEGRKKGMKEEEDRYETISLSRVNSM